MRKEKYIVTICYPKEFSVTEIKEAIREAMRFMTDHSISVVRETESRRLRPLTKIDGLREAVEKLKREPPPWTGHALTSQETSILNEQARYANIANEVIDSVLKIIDRAQLAAQEGEHG